MGDGDRFLVLACASCGGRVETPAGSWYCVFCWCRCRFGLAGRDVMARMARWPEAFPGGRVIVSSYRRRPGTAERV